MRLKNVTYVGLMLGWMLLTWNGVTVATGATVAASPASASHETQPRHKLVLAHYMPSYALDINYARSINPYAPNAKGGEYGGWMREAPILARNWFKKTPPWGKDLHAWARREMRLATKAGIDGFVFDYGASRRTAPDGLHEFIAEGIIGAFYDVAQTEFPDFKLTLCLDQATIKHRERRLLTIQQFLKRFGDSPNMLRINGKIAFASYRATALPPYPGGSAYPKMTDEQVLDSQRKVIDNWKWIWSQVGRPVAFIADMPSAWMYERYWKVEPATAGKVFDMWADAFAGLSVFGPLDTPEEARKYDTMMAKACRARGKLFLASVSFGWRRARPKARVFMHGSDPWRDTWALARDLDASGVQIVTWNDYTEETDVAPSINHNYALWQLTGFFSQWFKQGTMPTIDRDRLFLFYRRYAGRPKPTDFPDTADPWYPLDDQLEVLTLLKAPAELVVGEGKDAKRVQVPAGLHSQRFPLPLSKPYAALYRDGRKVTDVRGLAPVTDQPYRTQYGTYVIGNEFNQWFKWDAGFTFNPADSRWTDIDHNGIADWVQLIDPSQQGKVKPVH